MWPSTSVPSRDKHARSPLLEAALRVSAALENTYDFVLLFELVSWLETACHT